MPADKHPYDDVAEELTQWINEESKYYVDALKAGHSSPFGAEGNAKVSEEDKLRYYERQVFNVRDDGTINYDSPNEGNREALLTRVGIDGFTQVMTAVMAEKHRKEDAAVYDMTPQAPPLIQTPAPPQPQPDIPEGTPYG